MAIDWNIVEAIGTWFSGIITAGTLLFMYVQYHNDKKERFLERQLDGMCNFITYSIETSFKDDSLLVKLSESDVEIDRCRHMLDETIQNTKRAIDTLKSRIAEVAKYDHIRGAFLKNMLMQSEVYMFIHMYELHEKK